MLSLSCFKTFVGCISAQKLDLQKSISRNAKSINQSVSNQSKPSESTYAMVTEPEKVVKYDTSSFSDWIIASYKWLKFCRLEVF